MAPEVDALVGRLVDERYRILEPMASGSMGAVYKAERVPVGKLVAVKFLHASYANDSEFLARFERETRVMSKLAHPNCVSVVDFGVWEGAPYLVMEYVNGSTLRTIIDQGALAIPRALTFARQITSGLAHAHAQGITHRDVKPANIMISEEIGAGEHVRILDFGLARLRGAGGRDATQSNVVVGTPNYMAPEQTVGGGTIDARTDVYAVGVVLFEMIAGARPFKADDTLSLLGMHRTAPVPRLEERAAFDLEVPAGLQEVIETAMAKRPADRFQSAIELAEAIDALGLRPPSPTDPRGLPIVRAATPLPIAATTLASEPTLLDVDSEDDSRNESATAISSPRAAAARGAASESERKRSRRAASEPERKPASSGSRAGIVIAVAVLGGGAYGAYYFQQKREPATGSAEGSGAVALGSSGSAADGSGTAPDPAGSGSAPDPAGSSSGSSAGSDSAGSAAAGSAGSGSGDGSAASGSAAGSGSSAGSGAGSGEVEQAPDPGQATNPAPPRAGSAADNDEADDAPKTQADLDKRAKPPAPVLATTIPDIIKLIQDNKRDLAFASLQALYKKQPTSAYIPFLLGNLYFDQRWWSVAMENYRAAISRNAGYRSNAILIRNVITMLVSKKTDTQAENFLKRTIGKPALPYLRETARIDPNPYLRKYASALAKQIR